MNRSEKKVFLTELTFYKQQARKNGSIKGAGVVKLSNNPNIKNGHIVEIAMCHMLGIFQRYNDSYFFNIHINKEDDAKGRDIVLQTKYGEKYIQLKHTFRVYGREYVPGTYVVPVQLDGSTIMNHFLGFYKLPFPELTEIQEKALKIELDYIWMMYMMNIQEEYSEKY